MTLLDASIHGRQMMRVISKVAPDLPVSFIEVSDSMGCDPEDMARYVDALADPGILCLCWGAPSPSEPLRVALASAAGRGIYTLAAAGNWGVLRLDTCDYPAQFDGVIAVGSCSRWWHLRSAFSPRSSRVDILAPGEGWHDGWLVFGKRFAGTSPACAFASACADMVLKIHKDSIQSVEDLRYRLLDYTVPAMGGARALDAWMALKLRRELRVCQAIRQQPLSP